MRKVELSGIILTDQCVSTQAGPLVDLRRASPIVIAISIVKGAMEAFAEYLAALIPLLP
jgi:hypothetical protein